MRIVATIRNKFAPLLLVINLFVNPTFASASTQLTEHLKMVGQGELSWFFIDIFEASLYSQSGLYDQKSYPHALNIVYQKDISKQRLLRETEKEWKKLASNNKQHSVWLANLDLLWNDIKKGDQLLFMVEGNGAGSFYHNKQLLGSINNKQFSDAFLSIWLSNNTSQPKLRRQLLGL